MPIMVTMVLTTLYLTKTKLLGFLVSHSATKTGSPFTQYIFILSWKTSAFYPLHFTLVTVGSLQEF